MLHTILGAGGAIGANLVDILLNENHQVRLVSRKKRNQPGCETVEANVLNKSSLYPAIKGSDFVYLLVGIEYKTAVWQRDWPVIMANVLDVCEELKVPLLFFDNVYMYGHVQGLMTESTPFNPCSKKGNVRAQIANMLLDRVTSGRVKALIARSADFYGPHSAQVSFFHQLVLARQLKKQKAQWMISAKQPHSLTFTPDAAKALYLLTQKEDSFGKTWHLPTAKPALTAEQLANLSAEFAGSPKGVSTLQSWMLKLVGFFVPVIKESEEMNYQVRYPYHFDSSAIEKHLGVFPTPYAEGIRQTLAFYKN